jgi:hypothetical protein
LYSEAALPQKKAWIGTDSRVQSSGGELELACVADPGEALRDIASSSRESTALTRLRPRVREARWTCQRQSQGQLHPTRAVTALLEHLLRGHVVR